MVYFRYRINTATEIMSDIKKEWTPPEHAAGIHWDEKLMSTLDDKYSYEERLPVLISGIYYHRTYN